MFDIHKEHIPLRHSTRDIKDFDIKVSGIVGLWGGSSESVSGLYTPIIDFNSHNHNNVISGTISTWTDFQTAYTNFKPYLATFSTSTLPTIIDNNEFKNYYVIDPTTKIATMNFRLEDLSVTISGEQAQLGDGTDPVYISLPSGLVFDQNFISDNQIIGNLRLDDKIAMVRAAISGMYNDLVNPSGILYNDFMYGEFYNPQDTFQCKDANYPGFIIEGIVNWRTQ